MNNNTEPTRTIRLREHEHECLLKLFSELFYNDGSEKNSTGAYEISKAMGETDMATIKKLKERLRVLTRDEK